GGVVGAGLDPPEGPAPSGFAASHGLGRYLLYAGRLERGKRVDIAVEYAARLITESAPDLRLVLIGSGSYQPPRHLRDRVLRVGYVDDTTKRAAYAEALALVNPSEMESLSLVLLEAWREGTPALVAHGSEVMREHCERSGGGVAFRDYAGFASAVRSLLDDPVRAVAMGAAGRDYVAGEYGWDAVATRFRAVLDAVLSAGGR
ncbi:MAG: glycosyltransferase, partial [Miltoncostaeaceae bacterium]